MMFGDPGTSLAFERLNSQVTKLGSFAQGLQLLIAFDEPDVQHLLVEVYEGSFGEFPPERFIMGHRHRPYQANAAFSKPALFDIFDRVLRRIRSPPRTSLMHATKRAVGMWL